MSKELFKRYSGIDLTDYEIVGKFPKFKGGKWIYVQRGQAWKEYAEWLENKLTTRPQLSDAELCSLFETWDNAECGFEKFRDWYRSTVNAPVDKGVSDECKHLEQMQDITGVTMCMDCGKAITTHDKRKLEKVKELLNPTPKPQERDIRAEANCLQDAIDFIHTDCGNPSKKKEIVISNLKALMVRFNYPTPKQQEVSSPQMYHCKGCGFYWATKLDKCPNCEIGEIEVINSEHHTPEPQEVYNRVVYILTDIENGKGLKPEIQDINFWKDAGYVHFYKETKDAVTLSKQMAKGVFHCSFLPQHEYISQVTPKPQERVKEVLEMIIQCPYTLDEATIPKSQDLLLPQVVGMISIANYKRELIKQLATELNKEDTK